MPRKLRKISNTNIYHVVIRGINRQIIFNCEEDNIVFLHTLKKYRIKSRYRIFAYCLMGNHVHLLMKTESESISCVMKRICCSYAFWYNKKYERSGHLFQGRFHSEPVETSRYLFAVIRYIHLNPVKIEIVKNPEDYRWSSYFEYIKNSGISDRDSLLKLLDDNREKALNAFKDLHRSEKSDLTVLDIKNSCMVNDESAAKIITNLCNIKSPKDITTIETSQKNSFLRILLSEYNLPIRQLSKLTGVTRDAIRILKK